jgi:hypothetical protein
VELMRKTTVVIAALAALLAIAGAAEAKKPSIKKGIWGPVERKGVSQFPIYRDLGAGIYHPEKVLAWNEVAPTRPADPTNPSDPAYQWPPELDQAVAEGRRYGIKVALTVMWSPRWANGGRPRQWAPNRRDYARFLRAAARRYPSVRLWQIWGEPSRRANFLPLPRFEATGPRRYARLLDAAYGALKRESRRNRVIGGNTFTTGDVSPKAFIKGMRLPNGRRPRMDMYGHNPFSARRPALRKGPLGFGFADFSDLDTLARWVDRYLGRGPGGRRLKLYLSEFTIPTDHANFEFNFYATRAKAATWLRSALRITRRWPRIYTLAWIGLYDDSPNGPNGAHGDEVHRGLLDWTGAKKPAYGAFKEG